MFPISRDPPEGGTFKDTTAPLIVSGFQFLGIPPKGELLVTVLNHLVLSYEVFPISRDPPEGGTLRKCDILPQLDYEFPISRDPPEGGT